MAWTVETARRGAVAKAEKIRALYASDPKRCKSCANPILPKPGERLAYVKVREFCIRSCAAEWNNRHRTTPRRRKERLCAACGIASFRKDHRKFCPTCWTAKLDATLDQTKVQLSRSFIGAHARVVLGDTKACVVCGYDKHVEAAHRRAVEFFPSDATLREINAPENLVGLCPNCHWEYDHGLLAELGTRA
jgi:hypothetical protein